MSSANTLLCLQGEGGRLNLFQTRLGGGGGVRGAYYNLVKRDITRASCTR